MGLLSDLIQTTAKSRGKYIAGKRQGERERTALDMASRKEQRESEMDQAQMAVLRRQASLRDPNDPDVLKERYAHERAMDKQRGIRDEIAGLRATIGSYDPAISASKRDQARDRRELQSAMPPLAQPGTPEYDTENKRRQGIVDDTLSRNQDITRMEAARSAGQGRLRELLNLPPEPKQAAQAPTSYQAGGQSFPTAARAELAELGQTFLQAKRAAEQIGDRQGVAEAQRLFHAAKQRILAKYGAAEP